MAISDSAFPRIMQFVVCNGEVESRSISIDLSMGINNAGMTMDGCNIPWLR